jgi:hypothetical protein
LPEVLEAKTVYVCEGEKKAERLNTELKSAGLFGPCVATTAPMGAGQWRPEFSQALTGKAVVVLPDNDEKGAAHGAQVCAATSGLASSLRLLPLPELSHKGDVADFLEAGGTLPALFDLVEAAPEWTPQEAQLTQEPQAPGVEAARPLRFRLRSLAEIEELTPKPAFVEGVAPSGCIFGLVGPWGCGKSFVAVDWAMCAATGRDWQGRKVSGGPVIYITPEGVDAFGKRTKAWREDRGGERPDNFHLITDAPQVMQPGDVEELLRSVETMPEPPTLIVIDTVARHMVGGDENGQRDMGLFVHGLDRLRKATSATVLVVHHTGNNGKMRGSTALPGALEAFVEVKKIGEMEAQLISGKAKDEAPFAPIDLKGRVVDWGEVDANGKPINSLVFDIETRGSRPQEVSKEALQLLKALPPEGGSYSEWRKAAVVVGIPGGSFDRLKKMLMQSHVTQNPYSKRYLPSPSNHHQNAITMAPPSPE